MTYITNLLPQAELDALRLVVDNGVLPTICNIISRVNVNTKGVQTIVEGTAYADVRCRFYADQRENSRSYRAGEVMSTMTEWIITLSHDQELHNGWYVEANGERYEVVGVYDDPTFKLATRADLVRLHIEAP